MKVVTLLVSALAFAAVPAGAYLGEVVGSFNTANLPGAVATSGDYIYVFCAGRYLPPFNTIFQLNATTGGRVRSYVSPFGSYTTGLGYEYGGYLWIGNYSEPYSKIVRCDEETGSIYSSFRVTRHAMFGGVACEGDPNKPGTLRAIISNAFAPEPVTRHTAAGTLLNTFRYPERLTFFDPAWDYGNALVWWGDRTGYNACVYGFTTVGSLAASFPAPAGNPYGCTYLDGYLWISTDGQPDYIWKVHYPEDFEGLAPTSVGRVKALFR